MGLNGAGLVPGGGGGGGAAGPTGPTGPTGGGGSGSPVVRKFPFAFNTPNILTGATLYTPTTGDILVDAWIELDTAWNGTTPLLDYGDPTGLSNQGWLAFNGQGARPMDAGVSVPLATGNTLQIAGGNPTADAALAMNTYTPSPTQSMPAKLLNGNPIMVWVTQNGMNNGASPGSTQGAAILYLITSTPT